jgi:hypothetical protein
MMDPAVLRRLVEQWRADAAWFKNAKTMQADVQAVAVMLASMHADRLDAALALSVDRVNSLCTCGVLTGGVRSPSPHCPVHAYEGETDA